MHLRFAEEPERWNIGDGRRQIAVSDVAAVAERGLRMRATRRHGHTPQRRFYVIPEDDLGEVGATVCGVGNAAFVDEYAAA
jgi:hypothetical protein